ncbi:hypothetical protein Q669_28820 [Labrenzia sp. C1B10]|nr:hypothetical protein Q669_28820 [Labrenzia sp. C1B10]ERS06891.1 hypothetical protein Q675_24675 [Labrenzia sp. C1B70]
MFAAFTDRGEKRLQFLFQPLFDVPITEPTALVMGFDLIQWACHGNVIRT